MTATVDVLRARDIGFVRGGRHLLADVTETIKAGQSWVVLGPNGAGKCTLLSLFGAIAHPTSGTVDVLGHRLGRVDMRGLRTHIGHVSPRHQVDAPLTAREGGADRAHEHPGLRAALVADDRAGPPRRRVDRLPRPRRPRRRKVWQVMSQGERGRTLIARALIGQPHLLILDEPATGLDLAREQLLAAMDGLRRSDPQLSTVLVTHHIEEIPATTSHALLLRDGRIIARGEAADVLTSEAISACFDHPTTLARSNGRWFAQAV